MVLFQCLFRLQVVSKISWKEEELLKELIYIFNEQMLSLLDNVIEILLFKRAS